MKKLIYICLCILISINFTACNVKKLATASGGSTANNSSVNKNNVENNKNNEANKTAADIDNSVNSNSAENKKEVDSSTSTSQNTNSNNSNIKATSQASNATAGTKNSAVQNNNISTSTLQKQGSQKKSKVIVIDPGHANRSNLEKEPLAPGSTTMKIKDGGGAQGVATGTPEYRVNMNVSLKLKALLQNYGYTVVMTKTQDSQSLGNVERANVGNNANADLVIRIHADSSTSTSAKGASMLVPSPINDNTKAIYSASKSYGKTVLNTLVQEVGMQNRGVTEHSDMTGFNWSKVPVILVEMGFLSNPNEDKLLSSDTYENKIAKALADGIITALE
ncbi:N-acetylmuramoyl-L-alanine amidase family protein [Candidatus Clostridium radicumherbarum]|uniref:N-acetylmuramoyl-L-alanine amidase n=1 Tax=Candidatus Clostridium radicumherbarum TaxID=3381662 RepID=A0ABW8TXW9_9CLOT